MHFYEFDFIYILVLWAVVYISSIFFSASMSSFDKLREVWKYTSKIISIFHASVVVSMSIRIIFMAPEVVYYNENIDIIYPNLFSDVRMINATMFGYLFFDFLTLIIINSDENSFQTLIHHLIGGISMIEFYRIKSVYWNSLYYAITEFSTIFLHLTWFFLKTNSSKISITILGGLTWLSFFIIRILGGIWLLLNVYMHAEDVKQNLSFMNYVFFVYANLFVVMLNFYWFWKLTMSLLKHMKGEKIKTN